MAKLKKSSSKVMKEQVAHAPNGDEVLLPYACFSNMAYALTLQKENLLTHEEFALVKQSVNEILFLAEHQSFALDKGQKSIYQAMEAYLKNKLGKLSDKISRSREDQIAQDFRLFMRDHALKIMEALYFFGKSLLVFAERFQHVVIPYKVANGTFLSLGTWGSAFLESLLDDLKLLKSVYELLSSSVVSLEADSQTQMFAKFLGLKSVFHSKQYTSTVQGKFEADVQFAYVQVMNGLAKMSSDLILFGSVPDSCISLEQHASSLALICSQAAINKSLLFQILDTLGIRNACAYQTLLPLIKSTENVLESIKIYRELLLEIKIDEKVSISSKKEQTMQKICLESILKCFEDSQKWVEEKKSLWNSQSKVLS